MRTLWLQVSALNFELFKWKLSLYYEEPDTGVSQNLRTDLELHYRKGLKLGAEESGRFSPHFGFIISVCRLAFCANWLTLWVHDSHPTNFRFISSLIKTPGQTELESNL